MITQNTVSNNDNLYPLNKIDTANKVDASKENTKAEIPSMEKVVPKDPEDVVTFSENGKIDSTFFNYLDKGGDASETLSEGVKSEASFSVKPNFLNVSAARYAQMKSEIERNFADDPGAKSKYLSELSKAFEDYTKIQAKIIAEVLDSEETSDEEIETNNEETKKLYETISEKSDEKTKAIIEKMFGKHEDNYSDEISEIVDDFFIKTLVQKLGNNNVKNAFNQELKDPKITQMWNTIKFQNSSSE